MTGFGILKKKGQRFYSRHAAGIGFLMRFLLALLVSFLLRESLGFCAVASQPVLLLVISLITAALPLGAGAILGGVLLTAHAFALDLVAGGVTLCILLILFLLFLRFVPEELSAFALTPVALFLGFDPLPAILCGEKRSPASLFAVCPGAVVYAVIRVLHEKAALLLELGENEYLEKLQLLIQSIFTEELALRLIALAACLTLVYAVRSMSADYGPHLGALLGGLVYLLFLILGYMVLGTELVLSLALLSTGVSVIVALVVLLLTMPLHYRESEFLQFEDDEYRYYVKAVPKADGTHYAGEAAGFHQQKRS